eukprot:1131129_1
MLLVELNRYLYPFSRESFENFPLDFIANLCIFIGMLCYVLAPIKAAPWSIEFKLRNPDSNIASQFKEKPQRKEKSCYMTITVPLFGYLTRYVMMFVEGTRY